MPIGYRIAAMTLAVMTLLTAILNNPILVAEYQLLTFFNHDKRLFPGPLLQSLLPGAPTGVIYIDFRVSSQALSIRILFVLLCSLFPNCCLVVLILPCL